MLENHLRRKPQSEDMPSSGSTGTIETVGEIYSLEHPQLEESAKIIEAELLSFNLQ